MPRRNRSHDQTGWHHVTNRGARRQVIFPSDAERLAFGGLLADGHERFGVTVLAYCLMDNHFHLVLDCPDGGLSDFMHRLGGGFARIVNDRLGTDGPLFRGRFFSRPLLSHEYLRNAVRYVHRNPLAIPGVTAESFRWSSHRTYVGLRSCPVWLDPRPVLSMFQDVETFHECVTGERDLGTTSIDPHALGDAVDQVVDEAMLVGPVQGTARTVTLLLATVLPPDQAAVIDASLSVPTPASLDRARRRALAKAVDEPILVALAARALELATGCAVSNLSVVPPDTFDTAQPSFVPPDTFDTAQLVRDPYGEVA